jgi:protein-S-isoprenylcysteine O-methyltransferase Ste14
MIALQAYYALRIRLAGEHRAAESKAFEREGWVISGLRSLRSLLLIAFLVLFAIQTSWFEALAAPIPDWIRWLGVVPGVLSLPLYAWSRQALGRQWSSYLQMRDGEHRLVTNGPYARIRHPIYLAMLAFLTGLTLVAANWLFAVFLSVSIADLALRIPREEQMLIEAFGEEYVAYMKRTGRIFPI